MNCNNVSLKLEEFKENNNYNNDINKLLDNLKEQTITLNNNINNELQQYNLLYFNEISCYNGEMYIYYNDKYTVKELMKICNYYGISKNIKASKCKKQDIIETIVYYESCIENYEIVNKRHLMWAYIRELLNDNKIKQFIIWN
jgi:hypothetical protein